MKCFISNSGLTAMINLRSAPMPPKLLHTYEESKDESNIPYMIKISSKTEALNMKINVNEIRPGFHTTFRVFPEILDFSDDIEGFDQKTRHCKLPEETEGLLLLKKYSQGQCHRLF